jgi:hypothetical protein
MTDDPNDPTETAAAPSRDDRLMPEPEAMTTDELGEEPEPSTTPIGDGREMPDPRTLPDEP